MGNNNQRKSKIIDNSGDKKYFAMIPYYIVNHSSAYEQSLYLVMKRIASENGTCWASPDTIGKRMKVCPNTVRKNQNKLLKRGWIKIIGSKGKTKPTNEFEIVDLWKLNMDYYTKKESSTNEQSIKESSPDEKIVQQVSLVSSLGGNKEETVKEELLKKNVSSFNKIADYKIGKKWGEEPYYRGSPMRWKKSEKKFYVIENGEWFEFNTSESEIEWRKYAP